MYSEQDDEYLASLQADREKELKAKEEAEAALAEERRREEEFRKKQEEEQVYVYLTLSLYGSSSNKSLVKGAHGKLSKNKLHNF